MSSILRSSKFVRYFFGLARSIVISNRQEFDGGLLQRSQQLTGLFSHNLSSSSQTLQSVSFLEQTVRQLDEEARRSGRVSVSEVEEALHNIKRSKRATASQSLLIIRCCGNLVPEETPEQRTKLVEEIWNTFETIGVPLDISHYNALLKVYLENEHKFSPTQFLARLEANGIEPNRVTYQRLIAGFCQQGDIAGATKILEFMKEKQLPVSEGVFNALILGHCKSDDMQSAEGILNVMRQASLEPSNETYATLLSGYAARGDSEAVQRLVTECKLKDVLLSDRDWLEIGYAAAINGHDDLLDEILKNIRYSMGYNQDAANVILRLITAGKDEAAYKVFLTLNPPLQNEGTANLSGHLFIKQLVKSNRPADQIISWCERLQRDGHTPLGLWIAIEASFHCKNPDSTLDLLRILKQTKEPVRTHYFWPSLVTAGKAKDLNRMNDIIRKMVDEFKVPVNSETLKDYYLPYVLGSKCANEILTFLDNCGVKKGQAVVGLVSYLISRNKVKEASELAEEYWSLNYRGNFTIRDLIDALDSTGDVKSVVTLLRVLISSPGPLAREDKDEGEEETGSGDELLFRFVVNVVNYAPCRKHTGPVLKEMLEHGIPISTACAEIVQSKLQGNELTSEISELLAKLSSGDIQLQPLRKSAPTTTMRTPESLERLKQKMKANNEIPDKIISVNRSLYQAYCREGDVENARKIMQELNEEYKQETTEGMWAGLLDAYCMNNDLEGAKDCLEKIKTLNSEMELDSEKLLRLAKVYIENNQIDEAMSLVKSVKARVRGDGGFISRNFAWQALSAAADTYKDPEVVKKLLNLFVELKFAEASNVMLGNIIKAYLLRDDLEGALKEFEECVKLHRATPYKNELTIRLIEKEDATNLQMLVDLSTQVHGEVNSLYDLVLSFIECGKIRQARKILETPGLTRRNNRVILACERYKKDGKTEYLEGLVEATKDVPFIDRSEIYTSLLDTYCQADEVEKALGLWTKMQDEDVNISDEFLMKLGNFLKEKGQPVPFKIPKAVPQTSPASVPLEKASTKPTTRSPLMKSIQDKNVDRALQIKDELVGQGQQLSKGEVNRLVDLLVNQARLREATALLTSVGPEQMPTVRNLNFLVTKLAANGELELLDRVNQVLNDDLKKLTSLANRYVSAAVVAGKEKELLDKLEKEIETASGEEEIDRLATKFPRGGIMAVLEAGPTHYDQVARIVDKYYAKGSASPANCLVMHLLCVGDTEKARQLYQHYKLNNASQLMFRSVVARSRVTKDPKPLEDLIAMVEGSPAITPEMGALMYSNLINVYAVRGEFDTALQRLEEGLKTIPLDMFYTNSLEKLKTGLEANNKPFKYTIPPRRRGGKSSSSSSSSSETEPKKSVASN